MRNSTMKEVLDAIRESVKTRKVSKENLSVLCDSYDELKKKLSPELFALHQKFVDALEGSWCDEVDFYFAEGFKLGLRLGFECTVGE